MIYIVQADTARKLKLFIDFPHGLYRDDPRYVPELYLAQKALLTTHPFHEHSSVALFLAYRNKKLVGRIAAILNNNHNQFNGSRDGFFGFFDAVHDPEVSRLLFDTAASWLRRQGAETMIGPVNPSTNESCGLLVDGFDSPPAAMMTYNYPYYATLIEQEGFHKKTDLLAYDIQASDFNDRPARVMEGLQARLSEKGIRIRPGNLKDFDREVAGLMRIYNEAWDKNLGFVPMTEAEFRHMAKDVKLVLDKDFCLVAEHEGRPVAFALCIPDINQVQIRMRKGRLFPTGVLHFLFGRRQINAIRVIALGVTEPYRKMGIEAVFYGMIIREGLKKGIRRAEASWILEDNILMNRAIEKVNGKVYKRYRIYEKKLSS